MCINQLMGYFNIDSMLGEYGLCLQHSSLRLSFAFASKLKIQNQYYENACAHRSLEAMVFDLEDKFYLFIKY